MLLYYWPGLLWTLGFFSWLLLSLPLLTLFCTDKFLLSSQLWDGWVAALSRFPTRAHGVQDTRLLSSSSALYPHTPHTSKYSCQHIVCTCRRDGPCLWRVKPQPYHTHTQQSSSFSFMGLAYLMQNPPIFIRHCVGITGNRLRRTAYPRLAPFDREGDGEGYPSRGHRLVLGSVQARSGASRWVPGSDSYRARLSGSARRSGRVVFTPFYFCIIGLAVSTSSVVEPAFNPRLLFCPSDVILFGRGPALEGLTVTANEAR